MKLLTIPLTLCAVLATAGVAGCGDDGGVPGDAVATVDGVAIEKQAFDHRLAVTAKTNRQPRAEVREQVMSELVSGLWIEAEADARGVSVDDEAVRQDFERQKKLSFPQEAEFQSYLESSGQTEEDILERVRIDLLSSEIRDQVTGGEQEVTQKQIADYYKQNTAAFREPERRDVRVVLTQTRMRAAAAKAAVARGASWEAVARRHSIDRASRANGGKLLAVSRDQQEKRLGDAIFEARKQTLTGPVKARHGYYVFEVTRVFRPRRQSLEEARAEIERLLVSERRRTKLDAFTESFREEWRSRTECREGYIIADCRNGPDKPTPTQQARGSQP